MFQTPMKTIRQECPENQLYSIEAATQDTPGCRFMKTTIVEGSGEDGVVYRVCKECDNMEPVCLYVVKHIIKNQQMTQADFQNIFQKEVQPHITLRDTGIAPQVYDAFICGNEGYIVLDKKNYNVREYAFKLLDELKNAKLVHSILDQLETAVVRIINQLHTYKLVHGDPHLKNFMIDLRGSDLTDWRNLQIIDFGKTTEVESVQKANQDEPVEGIHMSFEMLKRDISDREKQLLDTDPQSVARRAILDKGIPEAPRKGKTRTAQPPSSAKKALENPEPEPMSSKKLKPFAMDFESPVKERPLASSLFGSSPSATSQPNFEMSDDSFAPSTPIKGLSFGAMTPMTPQKETDQEDEWAPTTSWSSRFDEDSDDDSFLSRRYYPYAIKGEDRYVDMVDPEYYQDNDYDDGSDYINTYEPNW